MALPTAAPRDIITSALWNRVVGAINGTTGKGEPFLLTDHASASVYNLRVRNSVTNGLGVWVQNSTGLIDLLKVNDSGVQIVGTTAITGNLTVSGSITGTASYTGATSGYLLTVGANTTSPGNAQRWLNSAGTEIGRINDVGFLAKEPLVWRPEIYGAKADGVYLAGACSFTGGSDLFTIAVGGTQMTTADIGKTCGVVMNSAGTTKVTGTITGVNVGGNNIFRLSTTATDTFSSPAGGVQGTLLYGTDSTAGLRACWVAMKAIGVQGSGAGPQGGIMLLSGTYLAGFLDFTLGRGITITGADSETGTGSNGGNQERGATIYPLPGSTGSTTGTTGIWIDFSGNQHCSIENVSLGGVNQGLLAGPFSVGLLAVPQLNTEMSELHFRRMFLTGSFSAATMLINGVQICRGDRVRLYNTNGSANSSTLRLDAFNGYNGTGITSPGLLSVGQHSINAYYTCDQVTFTNSQIHALTANCEAIWIDGAQQLRFQDCHMTAITRHIRLDATATADPLKLPQNIKFDGCWMIGAIGSEVCLVTANVTYANVTFERCATSNDVLIRLGGGAGTNTKLLRWRVIQPDTTGLYSSTPTHILAVPVGLATSNPRLQECYFECAQLDVQAYGTLEGSTTLINPGTITGNGAGTINAKILKSSGFLTQSGGASTPGYAFGEDENTGIYNPGADQMALVVGGAIGVDMRANRNVGIGAASLAGSATGGFICIPAISGTVNGTPTSVPSGFIPFAFNTTDSKLYCHNGSAWVATAALA